MAFKLHEEHWQILLNFMQTHPQFARGQFSGAAGKAGQKKSWEELSQRLNSLGYGSRTVEKWQKCWADLKYNIKRKAALKKRCQSETGGGPLKIPELTGNEQRIFSILGNTFAEGVGSEEIGLTIGTEENIIIEMIEGNSPAPMEEEEYEQRTPAVIQSVSPPQTPVPSKKRKISKTEEEYFQETLSELKNIRMEIQGVRIALLEINETLKNK